MRCRQLAQCYRPCRVPLLSLSGHGARTAGCMQQTPPREAARHAASGRQQHRMRYGLGLLPSSVVPAQPGARQPAGATCRAITPAGQWLLRHCQLLLHWRESCSLTCARFRSSFFNAISRCSYAAFSLCTCVMLRLTSRAERRNTSLGLGPQTYSFTTLDTSSVHSVQVSLILA